MRSRTVAAACLVILTLLTVTGCAVGLPNRGRPELKNLDQATLPDGTLVTVGPRRLIELVANRITTAAPNITAVDSLQFRDAAFPDGGWQLHEFLTGPRPATVAHDLQVDYLVLVTPLAYTMGDEQGFFIPLVAGAQSSEHKATLTVAIYDLGTGAALRQIEATSTATERVLYYVIVFGAVEPQVVAPLIDALTEAIVNTINSGGTRSPSRIAVLAAERYSGSE